jgi:outer membrane protein, multidrug efflux system
MKLAVAAVALVQLLATCGGPPPYVRPDPSLPPAYRGEQQSSQLVPPMGALGWWEIFKDPELQQLLRTAVSQNYDVRIAAQRVLQARSELTITSSNRYPQINAVGSAQYTSRLRPSRVG